MCRQQPDSVKGLGVFIQDACCTWSRSEEQALNMERSDSCYCYNQDVFSK